MEIKFVSSIVDILLDFENGHVLRIILLIQNGIKTYRKELYTGTIIFPKHHVSILISFSNCGWVAYIFPWPVLEFLLLFYVTSYVLLKLWTFTQLSLPPAPSKRWLFHIFFGMFAAVTVSRVDAAIKQVWRFHSSILHWSKQCEQEAQNSAEKCCRHHTVTPLAHCELFSCLRWCQWS